MTLEEIATHRVAMKAIEKKCDAAKALLDAGVLKSKWREYLNAEVECCLAVINMNGRWLDRSEYELLEEEYIRDQTPSMMTLSELREWKAKKDTE